MRDRLTSTVRRGTSTFGSFTPGQKAVTVFAIVALAVGGYFFSTWAGKPTYAPLFSNLAGTDASAIVEKLTADGTPYQLTDGGGTIMVPRDQVYDLRLKMSGEGLPAQDDAGYALLDKQGVMTSEFMQNVAYRRALEGELAKTVKSIQGVTSATVHLALPQKDVFTDDQQKPTASVLVATQPGKPLSADKVQSVVHLVASSVEAMEPEQVTVVGANGVVLSGSGQDGASAGNDARTTKTQEYEQRLSSSLQRMLDQVVGTGHAAVQVTADLDFDSTETKTQKYVADPAVPPLSESKKTEAYTGAGGNPATGVLGPDNVQVPTNAGGSGTYQQSTETKNNAVGMVTETRKSAPGAVRKLSVAVLVDSGTANGVNEAQLQSLVSSAVGLDAQRGDTIAVSTLPFDNSAAERTKADLAQAEKAEQAEEMKGWMRNGAIVAAIVILLLIAMLSGRKKRKTTALSDEERAQLDQMHAAIEAARAREALEGGGGGAAALESGTGSAGPGAAELASAADREHRQREISALVERQPDEVATLLRGWLADRRG